MAKRQPDEIRQTPAVYGETEHLLAEVEYGGPERLDADTVPPRTRLVSIGRLKPATLDLLSLGRPLDASHEISISEALNEQRTEE